MKRLLWAFAVSAVALFGAERAHADHYGKVPWVKNPAQGMAAAKKSGKPILLFFSASW